MRASAFLDEGEVGSGKRPRRRGHARASDFLDAPDGGERGSASAFLDAEVAARGLPTADELSAEERAVVSRPARMTLTRGGQPVVQPNGAAPPPMPPAVAPSADWGEVVRSLPAQFVAGGRSAAANLRRMAAEERIAGREEALKPQQSDPSGWGALVKPSAIERQRRLLGEDREALARAEADAAQAASDARLVTPKGMTIPQEALSSLAQSSGPTLLGLAAGILTRNVPLAMAIAGGGGSAQQAGSTYGEARERGAAHRQASVAATIDGALEGLGEALPIGFALRPGTPIYMRILGTISREAGQETATQLAQDLRALAMEKPDLTFDEVWRNMKVAALAGAGGGAVYGGAGAAVNAARERARTADEVQSRVSVVASHAAPVLRQEQPGLAPVRGPRRDGLPAVADELSQVPRGRGAEAAPLAHAGSNRSERQLRADELPMGDEAAAGGEPALVQDGGGARQAHDDRGGGAQAERAPDDIPNADLSRPGRADGGESGQGAAPELSVADAHAERTASARHVAREGADAGAAAAGDPVGSPERPAQVSTAADVRAADARVDPEPTPAQKDAQNYAMGHVRWQGLEISIETPKGGTRTAKDGSWSVPDFPASYGRFKGTRGADGDHVDTFIGDNVASPRVFVIDQVDPRSGAFDEHKVMLGFRDRAEALAVYDAAFTDGSGPSRRGAVSALSVDELKTWLRTGETERPFNARALAENHGRPAKTGSHVEPVSQNLPPAGGFRDTAPTESSPAELAAAGIAMTPPYSAPMDADAAAPRPGARPDAIRQAIRDLFRVPINEGRFSGSRDKLGIYKIKPRTIRVRNQNDIGVIAHETGHHFSETSREVRKLMKAHEREIRAITPYAAQQKTAALQREEGFAEYLRLRWTKPEHARAAAPGFSAAFEQYVDANGYRPAFNEIESAIRDWQNLPPADRILAKVGEGEPEFRRRFNLDRLIFEALDNWLPLKRMVEDLKPGIAPSADPFKLAHLLAGDAAIIEDWLLREAVPFDFTRRANVEDRGKPLADILKPVMHEQREFGAYLIAKRANELMRRGKEHLYSKDEIAAGLRLETPEFKAAAAELYEYQDRLLDYAVEGGLLSAGAANAFRQHPFYVPFFRVGEPLGQRGNIFKEIRGGTENLRDPIANVIENTVRVIHATNRNFVLAKAHDLARSVPGGGRWLDDVPMPERAVKLETQKIIEQLRQQGVEISTEAAEALATSQTFFVKNPFGDDRDRVIVIRRQGRPAALQVNDDMLWHALERFAPVDMGLVEKLLSVPADVLRAGIVLSPDFMARNFARDTLSGFIQSKAGILPVVGTVDGFREIASRSDAARLYRAFGGAYGDLWRADRGLERQLVERMARRGGFDPRTIVTPRGLIALLHRLGSVAEAGTRVAEFKKSVEAVDSIGEGTVDELIDAAYNAREVSVDFGMHGHSRSVRFLTRITPFLNPAMQGWYKAARTARSQPFTTLLRGGMLATASLLLYLNQRDDDWYGEIEQWERNTYWHLDIGLRDPQGEVIPLRIPKPFEWGAFFGSVPEALAAVAIDQHGERFAKRLKSIVDDVFMLRVIPPALLVPAELWANRNKFTDRPIVPESKERLAPELQATAGTSLTARKAGALTGTAPAKIDHAVRGFFGTLGTYTVMLADHALRMTGGEAELLPVPWQRYPVVKVFFSDPSGASSRYVTEFYELLREARRADASLRHLSGERASAYEERHRDKIAVLASANRLARELGALRRENDRLRESDELPAAVRAELIAENDRIIRLLAREYMRDVAPGGRPAEAARDARRPAPTSTPAGGAPRAQDAASARLRAIREGLRPEARPE